MTTGKPENLVSIVLPVYDALPYLEPCLDSVLGQSHGNIEVLAVDDGSTDGSRAVLEKRAASDERLTVFDQQRKGVSAARNCALDAAKGDFLLFADADDLMEPHLVETVLDHAVKLDADLDIFGNDEYFEKDGAYIWCDMRFGAAMGDRLFGVADLDCLTTQLVTANVWRVMFRTSFLRSMGARFHEDLRSSEDLAFLYELLFRTDRIAYCNHVLYHYRRDGGASITHADRGVDGMRALEHIEACIHGNGLESDAVRYQFANLVAAVSWYAMRTASSLEEYQAIHGFFRRRWAPLLADEKDRIAPENAAFCEAFSTGDATENLWWLFDSERCGHERTRVGRNVAEASEIRLRDELGAVRASRSYRLGNAFMRLPAAIRDALRGDSG